MESCIGESQQSGIIHQFPSCILGKPGIPASREILGKLGSREVEPWVQVAQRLGINIGRGEGR